MEIVSVQGEVRTDLGKKATKALRKTGNIPCVMYGGDQVVHFTASPKAFKKALYTPEFKLVEVDLGGKKSKCIVKDTQFHPVTDQLQHMDLLELVPGKGFNAQVPVHYEGESPGVKTGGKLIKKIRRVSVRMTPETMVDKVALNIDELELGFSVRVRDIIPVDGVVVTNPPSAPVASVEVPRALKSAEAAEEAEGGVAETEAPAEEAATE